MRGNGKKNLTFCEEHREAIEIGMAKYGDLVERLELPEYERLILLAYAGYHEQGVGHFIATR